MLYICTRLRKCLVDIFTSTALRQLAGAAVCFQLKVMCLGKTSANIAIKWFFINALHYAVKMQPSIIRFQAYSTKNTILSHVQSTIVWLFSCNTKRNVNPCILKGNISLTLSCWTERCLNQCTYFGCITFILHFTNLLI